MDTIGLIAAMTQESNALLRVIKGRQRVALGASRGHSFLLSGNTCLLVTCGMGSRRAGIAARSLVEMCSPRVLISFGIAGAVEPDLEIGDVILAEAACRLEQGVPGPISALASWSEATREAAAQALAERGRRLLIGTAVTTGGSQVSGTLLGGLSHPILEMETAGIAQVAAEKGVPLLSLRAISDGPRDPIPFELDEVMDENANLQFGRLLKAILHNPRVLVNSWRLVRNTSLAANNAALALVAALKHLTFP